MCPLKNVNFVQPQNVKILEHVVWLVGFVTKVMAVAGSDSIHDSHEIAILEFPTSDCSQNEAWCHAKRTDVTVPIENTWRRPNQHCKFNALVARIDDHSIVFNYVVWARCYHTVLNWPAILSERFVWCLKMTFNTRYRWKRGAHARAARRRVGCTQSHKIPHKISFCVNTAVSRKMWLK